MDSALSISTLTQVIDLIGWPILLGATLLAALLLTGVAERILNFVDDAWFPTPARRQPSREME